MLSVENRLVDGSFCNDLLDDDFDLSLDVFAVLLLVMLVVDLSLMLMEELC